MLKKVCIIGLTPEIKRSLQSQIFKETFLKTSSQIMKHFGLFFHTKVLGPYSQTIWRQYSKILVRNFKAFCVLKSHIKNNQISFTNNQSLSKTSYLYVNILKIILYWLNEMVFRIKSFGKIKIDTVRPSTPDVRSPKRLKCFFSLAAVLYARNTYNGQFWPLYETKSFLKRFLLEIYWVKFLIYLLKWFV